MAFNTSSSPKEDWMGQLEVNLWAGYKTLLGGLETASTMLQEHADIINPTSCTCKRACENSQFVMPVVVADDEVVYPVSSLPDAGTPSPFSPRERVLAVSSTANALPLSQADSATSCTPLVKDTPLTVLPPRSGHGLDENTAPAEKCKPASEAVLGLGHYTPTGNMGNFDYYAESVHPLRPPTSICSTNVSTAVRAAPWDKWMKGSKAQSASRTGTSLISKGEAGTSQAASALQKLQPNVVEASQTESSLISKGSAGSSQAAYALRTLPANPPVAAAQAAAAQEAADRTAQQQAAEQEAAEKAERERAEAERARATEVAMKQAAAEKLAEQKAAAERAAAERAAAERDASERAAAEQAAAEESAAAAKRAAAAEQASAENAASERAAAERAAAEKKVAERSERAVAKAGRADASGNDRKSTLSVSTNMTSSAAMALGAFAQGQGKRRSGSVERSGNESVILGSSAPKAMSVAPKAVSVAPSSDVGDGSALPDATVAAGVRKPAKLATRQSGSRSRGPDAKSVISGLNSSSSASALLGPMLAGQPKKRSARPQGADVASVI